MTRWFKWATGAVLGCFGAVLALWLGVHAWLLTEQAQQKLTQEASQALGVRVSVAKIRLLVWPLMVVELSDAELHTEPSLTLQWVRLSPSWGAILRGRLALSSLHVQGVELSQTGLLTLQGLQKKKQDALIIQGVKPENMQAPVELPGALTFEQVTWTAAGGGRTTVRGRLVLSDQGWVDDGVVEVLRGSFSGTRARLKRRGDHWSLDVVAGGGTVAGTMSLRQTTDPDPAWVLTGSLATRGVALTQLTLSPTLSGQLEADTSLSAQAASLGALPDVLKTQSKFTVRHAVLHGMDLARSVSTIGMTSGGQTLLDVLTGQLSSVGRVLQFNQLVASSGALSATGNVRVGKDTALSGRIHVALGAATFGDAVGVPLDISGTIAEPRLSLTRSALLGAAIGTAVMPGVGTGAGASIGGRVDTVFKKLFGR